MIYPLSPFMCGRGEGNLLLLSVFTAWRKRRISSGSLTPGAVSTPDDTSTACAPVCADRRLRRCPASARPKACNGTRSLDLRDQRPIERQAIATGQRSTLGGLASNRIRSAAPDIASARAASLGSRNRMALMTGTPVRLRDFGDALRRLMAVQLDDIRRNRVDDFAQRRVVGIDHQCHDLCAAAGACGQSRCCSQIDVARALGKKHQTDIVARRRQAPRPAPHRS